MALKPTIYKIKIDLSNTDLGHYDSYPLTIALHPSETPERMMARVLAFCINAQDGLTFTQGLGAIEEPDIWSHSLDGQIKLWIDVGEPRAERIKNRLILHRESEFIASTQSLTFGGDRK